MTSASRLPAACPPSASGERDICYHPCLPTAIEKENCFKYTAFSTAFADVRKHGVSVGFSREANTPNPRAEAELHTPTIHGLGEPIRRIVGASPCGCPGGNDTAWQARRVRVGASPCGCPGETPARLFPTRQVSSSQKGKLSLWHN